MAQASRTPRTRGGEVLLRRASILELAKAPDPAGEVVVLDLTLETGQLEVSVGVDEAGRDGRIREGPPRDTRRRGDADIRSDGRDPAVGADQHRTGGDRRPVDRQHPPGGEPNSGHVSAEAWPAWAGGHRRP